MRIYSFYSFYRKIGCLAHVALTKLSVATENSFQEIVLNPSQDIAICSRAFQWSCRHKDLLQGFCTWALFQNRVTQPEAQRGCRKPCLSHLSMISTITLFHWFFDLIFAHRRQMVVSDITQILCQTMLFLWAFFWQEPTVSRWRAKSISITCSNLSFYPLIFYRRLVKTIEYNW